MSFLRCKNFNIETLQSENTSLLVEVLFAFDLMKPGRITCLLHVTQERVVLYMEQNNSTVLKLE